MSRTAATINSFTTSLQALDRIISKRLKNTFSKINLGGSNIAIEWPLNGSPDPLCQFIATNELTSEEAFILVIALTPHIQPDFFDGVIQEKIPKAGDFPQIGGARGKNFRGFLPTGETALFLLAGTDMEKRFDLQKLFQEDHIFAKKQILWLEDPPVGEPLMSGKLVLSPEYIDLFMYGEVSKPKFSLKFPAQLVETQQEWEDLILNEETMSMIMELEEWLQYGKSLMYDLGMHKKLKPGFRVLFHGPPGTGKTMTASLLGKYTGRDVYKIDLSMVVSKFIGETEKNLSNLFNKAEDKNWILFFDEADALFGKRTNVKDAHDKYANQEVSYLLQRVETYNGLVILASNFKSNIDDAFMRRFQSIIHFPAPRANERLHIWERAFPKNIKMEKDLRIDQVANKYELSGAEIMNVSQYACIKMLAKQKNTIQAQDILNGIRKEYQKEGRIMR